LLERLHGALHDGHNARLDVERPRARAADAVGELVFGLHGEAEGLGEQLLTCGNERGRERERERERERGGGER
jgi:hypothetical protein